MADSVDDGDTSSIAAVESLWQSASLISAPAVGDFWTMPLEFSIRRPDGGVLGTADYLRNEVVRIFPGLRFDRSPTGREYIAAMESHGLKIPDGLRAVMQDRPGTERAVCNIEGGSVCVFGFLTEPIVVLHVEIRGDGDPRPFFQALCEPHGWVVIQDVTESIVFPATSSTGSAQAAPSS